MKIYNLLKKMIGLIILLNISLSLNAQTKNTFPGGCTVLSAASDKIALAGTNKDHSNTETQIWLIPPSSEAYGIVYFGYQVSQGFQNVGGMNDQGLWYDGASLPERNDIKNHYNKPTVKGELCEKALRECASVEEVISMYKKYFSPHWQGHSMWADKYGNSVIMEFGEKDVIFIRKKKNFQVMTNFYISDTTNARWYNCYRYEVANYMFENSSETSIPLFRSILDATHQTGLNPTVFSTIYDLRNGEVNVFNFHNYEEFARINLSNQLNIGEQYFKLPELFSRIKLIEPLSEDLVNSSSVAFKWYGNAQTYNLYCSQNPDFTDCTPIEVTANSLNRKRQIKLGAFSLTVFLFVGMFRRKKYAMILLIIISPIIFHSCEMDIISSPYVPSSIEHSKTIENLEPNTNYYWKIEAIGKDGINSESIAKNFTTTM